MSSAGRGSSNSRRRKIALRFNMNVIGSCVQFGVVESASASPYQNLYVGESSRLARVISSRGCTGFRRVTGLPPSETPHFSKRKRAALHVTV
jgi:hypothetical protein